jgi:hypothetical protein
MILWLSLAGIGFVVAYHVVPRLILALLTKGKIRSKRLMYFEVWDEIFAELQARRLVREVRREREGQR